MGFQVDQPPGSLPPSANPDPAAAAQMYRVALGAVLAQAAHRQVTQQIPPLPHQFQHLLPNHQLQFGPPIAEPGNMVLFGSTLPDAPSISSLMAPPPAAPPGQPLELKPPQTQTQKRGLPSGTSAGPLSSFLLKNKKLHVVCLENQQEKQLARDSWQRTARLVERGVRLLCGSGNNFFLLPGEDSYTLVNAADAKRIFSSEEADMFPLLASASAPQLDYRRNLTDARNRKRRAVRTEENAAAIDCGQIRELKPSAVRTEENAAAIGCGQIRERKPRRSHGRKRSGD